MSYSGLDVLTGAVISLDEAEMLTGGYQNNFPTEPKAYFIGAERLKQVLEQENCIGVRIYNGYDEAEGKKNLVLVGVNITTEDMTGGVILDKLAQCPNHCDVGSPLYFSS